MKVYKFKDLRDERKHSHFLQIVLEKAIWCAHPDTLKDEDEFKFKLDYEPSPNTAELLSQVIAQYRTTNLPPHVLASLALGNRTLENRASPIIDEVVRQCRNTRGITSFSLRKTNARLWEEYGGNGNGVCIEIVIPDSLVGLSFHRVHYVPEKIFHVDSFLESVLFSDKKLETYKNILLTKTKKWSEEEEIRFIGNRQNVNLIVDGYISEVTFGPHVPSITLERLTTNIAGHCSANNINLLVLQPAQMGGA